jgi:hypothetical protein
MSYLPRTALLLFQAIFSGRYLLFVAMAPLLLATGVALNSRARALNWRWLEWSPFHVKANVTLLPLRHRWAWLPYAVALGFCMPMFALMEEMLFRAGTTDWVRGLLWGTVAFGLCHLLFSFVSVRMTLYLMLVGAVLVAVYMAYGLLAAFVLHAVYNLTALTLTVLTRNRPLPGLLTGRPGTRLASQRPA